MKKSLGDQANTQADSVAKIMDHIGNLQYKAQNQHEKLVIQDSDLIKINGILLSQQHFREHVDTEVESRMERIDQRYNALGDHTSATLKEIKDKTEIKDKK